MHENLDRVIRNLASRDLRELPPLEISSGNREGQGNFKEVWQTTNCHDSSRLNAMYEAGASIYWLDLIHSLGGFEGDPVLNEDARFAAFPLLACHAKIQ